MGTKGFAMAVGTMAGVAIFATVAHADTPLKTYRESGWNLFRKNSDECRLVKKLQGEALLYVAFDKAGTATVFFYDPSFAIPDDRSPVFSVGFQARSGKTIVPYLDLPGRFLTSGSSTTGSIKIVLPDAKLLDYVADNQFLAIAYGDDKIWKPVISASRGPIADLRACVASG